MINPDAAKVAAVVGGIALFVLVVGQILRWFTRFMAWGLLVLTVVLLMYAAYRLAAGWSAAGEDDQSHKSSSSTAGVDDVQEAYLEGELNEEELEAQLADLEEELSAE